MQVKPKGTSENKFLLKTLITYLLPLVFVKIIQPYTHKVSNIVHSESTIASIVDLFIYLYCSFYINSTLSRKTSYRFIKCFVALAVIVFNYKLIEDKPVTLTLFIFYLFLQYFYHFQSFSSSFGFSTAAINMINLEKTDLFAMGWFEIAKTLITIVFMMFIHKIIQLATYSIKAYHNTVKFGHKEIALRFLAFQNIDSVLMIMSLCDNIEDPHLSFYTFCLLLVLFCIKKEYDELGEDIVIPIKQHHIYLMSNRKNIVLPRIQRCQLECFYLENSIMLFLGFINYTAIIMFNIKLGNFIIPWFYTIGVFSKILKTMREEVKYISV